MNNLKSHAESFLTKQLLIKIPKQDDHELTPATRLLEQRREMEEVDYGLKKQKEEYNAKMSSIAQRREELARKEAQLKESLVKFDKFLAENDGKKLRAIKKSFEEKLAREAKEIELAEMKASFENMQAKKQKQIRAIEANLPFHAYLETILEANLEYIEVKDIISRYNTLKATNTELINRSQSTQDQIEKNKQDFAIATKERNDKHLNCNNQIAKLRARVEDIKRNSVKWRSELDKQMSTATSKSLQLGQIKMATNNLFLIIKGHLNNRLNMTTDPVAQIDALGFFISDLTDVTRELKISQ